MKYGFDSKEAEIFPLTITIDITNRCNLRCIHCPQGQLAKSDRYIPFDIPIEYIIKIADDIRQHKNVTVRITGDGEPLLHPELARILRMIKSIDSVDTLVLFTNGLPHITLELEEAINKNVNVMDVSIDAMTSETYKKIHGRNKLQNVHLFINHMMTSRELYKSNLKIVVSFVDQPFNHHEKNAFIRYWQDKADKIVIRPFVSCKGLVHPEWESFPDKMKSERFPCPQLFRRLNINQYGEFKYCIDDMFNHTAYSNLWTHSIEEAWKHKVMIIKRQQHLNGIFSGICNGCTSWKMSNWNYTYEKVIDEVMKK